jgi:hypothetical protein
MADKTIDFEGIALSIPSDRMDLPVEAIEAWEEDRHVSFVKALVGPDAWGQFKARKPTMKDFQRLAEAIGNAYGFESTGESSGSEDSSKRTSEPSSTNSSPSTDSTSTPSFSAP